MMNAISELGRRWRLCSVALLAFLGSPAAVLAAPFCVTTQALPPQCLYVDPAECQKDALHQGGVCTVNSAEYKPQPGVGQYCVVGPSLISECIYPDRGTCMSEAKSRHGACVKAPSVAPYGAPDPYAAIGGH